MWNRTIRDQLHDLTRQVQVESSNRRAAELRARQFENTAEDLRVYATKLEDENRKLRSALKDATGVSGNFGPYCNVSLGTDGNDATPVPIPSPVSDSLPSNLLAPVSTRDMKPPTAEQLARTGRLKEAWHAGAGA